MKAGNRTSSAYRSDRLRELFREEISKVLRELKDPGLTGFFTLTDLQLSKDRKKATVYYSILGSDRERENARQALARSAPYIKHLLRKRIHIKVIPEVVFEFDSTPQKASRIDKLLLKLEEEKR